MNRGTLDSVPAREPFTASVIQWLRDYPGGAKVSERFKSAFRVALAMVITYGISLAMDWDKAFWAALSVIFCSLATTGQSVNASIDRILGTAAAAVLALVTIALFPQDRWPFLLSLSAVIAVCSYHLTANTPRKAIWFNAAFNLPIIAFMGESSGAISPTTFDLAILRVQQTTLGAVVYSVVAMLVWPRSGDQDFLETMRGIARAQQQLFTDFIVELRGRSDQADLDGALGQIAVKLPSLRGELEGAAYDNPELRLVWDAWVSHIDNVNHLHQAFERWGSGFTELEGLDLPRYLVNWNEYVREIEARLAGAGAILSGEPSPEEMGSTKLLVDEQALRELSHFQRAAVVSCYDNIRAIARLADALRASARLASGRMPAVSAAPGSGVSPVRSRPRTWVMDLDRLAGTLRQMVALWTTFLLIIYVEGIPIPVAVVALANAFTLVFIQIPHVSPAIMFKPMIQGALLGGVFYVLAMPHLSGYWALGSLLFLVIFGIAYLFHQPQALLFRAMWMTMLVLVISIENQQFFSFLVFAQWFLVGVLYVSIVTFASRFPLSFAPEHQFNAQLRRFWQSAAFVLADSRRTRDSGRLYRWRHDYHIRQLAALPPRLKVWSGALSPAAVDDQARGRVANLVRCMQLVGFRIQELQRVLPLLMQLHHVQSVQHQGGDTLTNLRALMDKLARNPGDIDANWVRSTLAQAESALEQTVEKTLQAGKLTREQVKVVYSALGAFRGLIMSFSEAMDEVVVLDWQRLCEARF